jgi:hypothetical protein
LRRDNGRGKIVDKTASDVIECRRTGIVAQSKHRVAIIDHTTRLDSSSADQMLSREITRRLSDRYTFRRPEEVITYLYEYPHLVPLLLNVSEVVPRYFGADSQLVLEVFTDPESVTDDRMLFVLVKSTLDPEERFERLHQLDEDWWLSESPNPPARLVIDIE